jgi:peptide/nickel transport system permease protein
MAIADSKEGPPPASDNAAKNQRAPSKRLMTRVFSHVLRVAFSTWAVMTICFVLIRLLPSDPARIAAGPQARPADVAAIRREMGQGEPAIRQYGKFWANLVRKKRDPEPSCITLGPLALDFGKSYQRRTQVTCLLLERAPCTLTLATLATVLAVIFGSLLGTLAAAKRGAVRTGVSYGSLLLTSAPSYTIGLVLQYWGAHRLGWFPLDGLGDTWQEHVVGLTLPTLTLAIGASGYYVRIVETRAREELERPYARTARAKGASRPRVLLIHVLRNLFAPLATLAALDLGYLASGAIITETLFRLPGIGTLSVGALLDRDLPILSGVVFFSSMMVVLANILSEVLANRFDRRLSAE